MVRKAAVQFTKQFGDLTAELAKNTWGDRPGGRVAGVNHNVNLTFEAAELFDDELLVRGNDRSRLFLPLAGCKRSLLDQLSQFLNLLPVDRDLVDTNLKAIIIAGIMTASDLYAAVQIVVVQGKVQEWRRARADINNIDARRTYPMPQRRGVRI
jgi:hypothetical protein